MTAIQLDRMEIQFEVVSRASVGCKVKCPRCGTRFTKRTGTHLFCTPDCKYEYKHIIQREIAQT